MGEFCFLQVFKNIRISLIDCHMTNYEVLQWLWFAETRDCNPGTILKIPGFRDWERPIQGSRDWELVSKPSYWILTDKFPLTVLLSAVFDVNQTILFIVTSWKQAIITAVPKTALVTNVSDMLPISTPYFVPIVERLVVCDYLIPYIPRQNLVDQYAFKASGPKMIYFVSSGT